MDNNNNGDDNNNPDYGNEEEFDNGNEDGGQNNDDGNNGDGNDVDQYFDDAGDIGYLPADHVTSTFLSSNNLHSLLCNVFRML
jgi:hypothetical protein